MPFGLSIKFGNKDGNVEWIGSKNEQSLLEEKCKGCHCAMLMTAELTWGQAEIFAGRFLLWHFFGYSSSLKTS